MKNFSLVFVAFGTIMGEKINVRNAQKALRDCFIEIDAVESQTLLRGVINVSHIHTFVLHGWILCTADMPVVLLGTAEFLDDRSSKCCTVLTGVNQTTGTLIVYRRTVRTLDPSIYDRKVVPKRRQGIATTH